MLTPSEVTHPTIVMLIAVSVGLLLAYLGRWGA